MHARALVRLYFIHAPRLNYSYYTTLNYCQTELPSVASTTLNYCRNRIVRLVALVCSLEARGTDQYLKVLEPVAAAEMLLQSVGKAPTKSGKARTAEVSLVNIV